MATYFTADLHIGHANILSFEPNRPWPNVQAMDEGLIARWNAVVRPDDDVYVLGDLALGPIEESLRKTSRLAGRKFLVPGNHDRVSSAYKPAHVARFTPLYEAAGWTILPETTELALRGHRFVLSHYPYAGDHTETDRYPHLRPVDEGRLLLHGHIHSLAHHDDRQFNVGVDVNDHAPVHEDVVVAWARLRSYTPEVITALEDGEVFVFGSNSDGRHAGGAARAALAFGAVWGEGDGLHGQSYAIDTMSGLPKMVEAAERFLEFARAHPQLRFLLTPIGCGIAGYTPEQVAPLFRDAPENVVLPEAFATLFRASA